MKYVLIAGSGDEIIFFLDWWYCICIFNCILVMGVRDYTKPNKMWIWLGTISCVIVLVAQWFCLSNREPLKQADTQVGEGREDYIHSVSGGPENGPNLVCMSGYGSGSGWFFRNIDGLAGTMKTILVDWLGTGLSGKAGCAPYRPILSLCLNLLWQRRSPTFPSQKQRGGRGIFSKFFWGVEGEDWIRQVRTHGPQSGRVSCCQLCSEESRESAASDSCLPRCNGLFFIAQISLWKILKECNQLWLLSCQAKKPDNHEPPHWAKSPWTFRGQAWRIMSYLWNSGCTPQMAIRGLGPMGRNLVEGYVQKRFQGEVFLRRATRYIVQWPMTSGPRRIKHAVCYGILSNLGHINLRRIFSPEDW